MPGRQEIGSSPSCNQRTEDYGKRYINIGENDVFTDERWWFMPLGRGCLA